MKVMYKAHAAMSVLAVGLMALPFGVNCYYASEGQGIDFSAVQSLSFFDMRLFEFQNVLPFFTAVFAVALLVLSHIRANKSTLCFNRVCAAMSAVLFVMTILPLLLFGTEYFTTVAMTAAFLFLCMTVVDVCVLKNVLLYTPRETDEEQT